MRGFTTLVVGRKLLEALFFGKAFSALIILIIDLFKFKQHLLFLRSNLSPKNIIIYLPFYLSIILTQ